MDFKVQVKVNSNPIEALKLLGKEVVGRADAFTRDNIDLSWIEKQDYITAVPIQIALTTEMRDEVMDKNPECRFIVTGVQNSGAEFLEAEYSYKTCFVNSPKVSNCDGHPEESVAYFCNGKPVSQEEFEQELNDLEKDFKALTDRFNRMFPFRGTFMS